MEDKRSTYIIDWIIKNNGAEPPEEMRKAVSVVDADAAAAYAPYASAAAVAVAAGAMGAGGIEARDKNRHRTADICREYLPLEMWVA